MLQVTMYRDQLQTFTMRVQLTNHLVDVVQPHKSPPVESSATNKSHCRNQLQIITTIAENYKWSEEETAIKMLENPFSGNELCLGGGGSCP